MRISPFLLEDPADGEVKEPRYRIKIINVGRRTIVDLRFEVTVIAPQRTKGGTILTRRTVSLPSPPPLSLPPRQRRDTEFMNVYRILVDTNLREALEEDPHNGIRLRILARDEISGIGRVFEQVYHEPTSEIRIGRYVKGQTFDVI